MRIWVDADACPKAIKDILFRAAERAKIPLTLVANRPLRTPRSAYVDAIQVGHGLDVADSQIVQRIQPGDLVVTADIPLAAAVIGKGGHALDPRGQMHAADDIGERLSVRNWMDALRGAGVTTGGPATITQSDRKAFADALDRFLSKHVIS